MIKTVIIEDKAIIRQNISFKIKTFFNSDIEIVGEAESVASGFEIIQKTKPDLLLLDIQLTDGTCFDLLDQLKKQNFYLIFITGFDNKAIKAIKAGALDYILKPIDNKEFKEAITRVINIDYNKKQLKDSLEVTKENYQNDKPKRVVLKTMNAYHILNEDEILYCKSDNNYTYFFTDKGERILISKTLKKTIEMLSKDIFIHCHQSYLVNSKHIKKYLKEGYIILKEGTKIPISFRKKNSFLNAFFK